MIAFKHQDILCVSVRVFFFFVKFIHSCGTPLRKNIKMEEVEGRKAGGNNILPLISTYQAHQ